MHKTGQVLVAGFERAYAEFKGWRACQGTHGCGRGAANSGGPSGESSDYRLWVNRRPPDGEECC